MITKILTLLLAIIPVLTTYNSDFGHKLCRLTVASYCAPAKVKDWTCKPCVDSPIKLSHVKPFNNSTGDVLGLIGTSTTPAAICKNRYIKIWFSEALCHGI